MGKVKRLVAALACAALFASPALGAEGETKFPAVNTYVDGYYQDVPSGSWYAEAAKLCYETGLMNGTDNGFEPQKVLTVAECSAIAARIREALTEETIVFSTPLPGEDKVWYQDYLTYLTKADPTLTSLLARPTEPITRQEYLLLLNAALPAEGNVLPAINAIQALPDTDDPGVLSFYNAGVLTGVDAYGTFNGGGTLSRAECAAMVARIVDPSLRQAFTPQAKPAEPPTLSYEEELMQTEALRVNGTSIPFSRYLSTLNTVIYETDLSLQSRNGAGLDWDAKYSGVDDLPAYFKDLAVSRVVEENLVSRQARALGCTEAELPAKLTPDPAKDLGKIYCAKHILVEDEATAVSVLATLRQNPSVELFDRLLAQHGTDPGMVSNPNGYLFTDGDMVSEFENAVKALNIGSCSSVPVKSQFGYHIILRLDPTGYPDWQAEWQAAEYDRYVDSWLSSATVTLNTIEIDKVDAKGRYEAFLASLNG